MYNKHSYKYSGIANAKTVDIRADGNAVAVTTKRSKAANQPAKSTNTAATKKHARRVVSAVGKNVGSYRPDLKKQAIARASAVQKSLRVKAAATKAK